MINHKRLCALFLVGGMLFLNGCEKVVELTAEEKEIVTLYAAKVVSKHNVRLSQGLVRYKQPAPEPAEDEAATEETEPSEETEAVESTDTESEKTEDSKPEDSKEEEPSSVTLTEAMAIDGIEFNYAKTDVYNDLQGSNSYIEEPSAGKKYVGVAFDVSNTTNDDIELALLTTQLSFNATIGSESVDSKSMAMLLDDLSTYVGTIKSGESKTLSIYFEFPEETVKDMSGLSLTADIQGKKSKITL